MLIAVHILTVHNRYLIRGGEDEGSEIDCGLLRSHGHKITNYVQDNKKVSELSPLRVGLRTVWSTEDYKALRNLIRQLKPDVVDVQNFFPLISPAVYYAAKAERVPVVQTLHNYRLLCPNAMFFRDGKVCEDCLNKAVPWPGVLHSCYRQSRAASGAVAAMLTTHRALSTWTRMIDVYVSLTEFARQKFIQGGLPGEKIMVKPNIVHPDPGPGQGRGGYAIFVGRLSPEKGIDTLLTAWERLSNRMPLKIVGDGPLSDKVAACAQRLPGVEWLGRRPLEQIYELVGEAAFLVFPSKWYETFGRVAVEAFAKGTPVIASKIGAISELLESGRTGLHFRPGDAEDLIAQVEWALAHPAELAQMRVAARVEFEAKYTADRHYRKLLEIYTRAARSTI